MIEDPAGQVLAASMAVADDVTVAEIESDAPSLLRGLRLARRRFGTSLPPPFVEVPSRPADLPVRPAVAVDGPACAAVQRRAWRARYRGLLPDDVLDRLDLERLGSYWTGRTLVPPSPRHVMFVAGRPGEVHGMVDAGPARHDPDGAAGEATGGDHPLGEVRSLCVDPTVTGHGLGASLLAAAVAGLADRGLAEVVLWVIDANASARRFYERHGWVTDGASRTTSIDGAEVGEVRYRRR